MGFRVYSQQANPGRLPGGGDVRTCKVWRERRKGRREEMSLVEDAVRIQNRQERSWYPVCRKRLINILKVGDSGVFSVGF